MVDPHTSHFSSSVIQPSSHELRITVWAEYVAVDHLQAVGATRLLAVRALAGADILHKRVAAVESREVYLVDGLASSADLIFAETSRTVYSAIPNVFAISR